MKITNVFDAVLKGTFEDFKSFYNGEVNQINPHSKLNLLSTAMLNSEKPDDKLTIIQYLLENGVDISFTDSLYKRNALHTFFFNVMKGPKDYMEQVVRLLVKNGVDVNGLDKFHSIPLKYAITVNKNTTEDMKEIYSYLVKEGSDVNIKDTFNKSIVDYAKEFPWRIEFLEIVKEYEHG
ncbi:ankyrin repeat domain-containing protein [Psychrobacillus sp. FSL W7-1457]|uniref:ankyrin repeat domain-containing protein n=1 Tax=unclassified Psychrobacillus TaxID=2636677 RepID=UPI0030F939D3